MLQFIAGIKDQVVWRFVPVRFSAFLDSLSIWPCGVMLDYDVVCGLFGAASPNAIVVSGNKSFRAIKQQRQRFDLFLPHLPRAREDLTSFRCHCGVSARRLARNDAAPPYWLNVSIFARVVSRVFHVVLQLSALVPRHLLLCVELFR